MRECINVGDTVLCSIGNYRAEVIEIPDGNRPSYPDCWLIHFLDQKLGHSGLGLSKRPMKNCYWDTGPLILIKRGRPLTDLEVDLQAYIDAEFKELGL